MGEHVPREAAVLKRIVRLLDERGAWHVKTCPPLPNGTPDLLVCYRGRFLAIEVKRPGGHASPLQRHVLAKISQAGGHTLEVSTEQTVAAVLAAIDEQHNPPLAVNMGSGAIVFDHINDQVYPA